MHIYLILHFTKTHHFYCSVCVVLKQRQFSIFTEFFLQLLGIDEGKQRERPKRKESGISVEFSKPDEVSQTDINVAEQPQGISIEMDITGAPEISATEIVLTKQEEIVSSDKSALEITLESTPKPGMNSNLLCHVKN